MITINFNTAARTATLGATTTERAGADWLVTVNFDQAPTNPTAFRLALVTADANPRVLSFIGVDAFTAQNETRWTASMDGNDPRLMSYMISRAGSATLALEFGVTIDGARQSPANLPITVQPTAFIGTLSSESGPTYYTQAEADAAIAAAVATALAGLPRPLAAVNGITGGGSTKLDGIPTLGLGYNIVQFVDTTTNTGWRTFQRIASTAATSAPGYVRVSDYDAVTNAYGFIARS